MAQQVVVNAEEVEKAVADARASLQLLEKNGQQNVLMDAMVLLNHRGWHG